MINCAYRHTKVRVRSRSLRFAIRDSRFRLRNSLFTFILAVTCMCALTTAADELQMTKIVFRRMSPDIAPDSFAAKPRMLYRVAYKYSRIEEPPHPEQGINFLVIISEPASWTINLIETEG